MLFADQTLYLFSQLMPPAVERDAVNFCRALGFTVVLADAYANNITSTQLYLTGKWEGKAFSSCVLELITPERTAQKISFRVPAAEKGKTVKTMILQLLQANFPELKTPSWGILTGVRPVKLTRKLLRQHTQEETASILAVEYLLPKVKAELLIEVAKVQDPFLRNGRREVALYVNIPYCASRCAYCSFPAGILPSENNFQQNFLAMIEEDLYAVLQLVSMYELQVGCIYIGGGTPTVLAEKYFTELLRSVTQFCRTQPVKEFSVEAGRPDSLSEQKVSAMAEAGVTRLSINPQTFSESTLSLIGRKHSVFQTEEAYTWAKKSNIPVLNMDFILGLPDETAEMMRYSLDQIVAYAPQNFTVHELSLKRGSPLHATWSKYSFVSQQVLTSVEEYAASCAQRLGMRPYEVYRQQLTAAHGANLSYALPGTECRYNVQMMSEEIPVIGVGPGAATKLPCKQTEKISKMYLPKNFTVYSENKQQIWAKRAALVGAFVSGEGEEKK